MKCGLTYLFLVVVFWCPNLWTPLKERLKTKTKKHFLFFLNRMQNWILTEYEIFWYYFILYTKPSSNLCNKRRYDSQLPLIMLCFTSMMWCCPPHFRNNIIIQDQCHVSPLSNVFFPSNVHEPIGVKNNKQTKALYK